MPISPIPEILDELCRIAINTALDTLKRAGRSPVQTVEDPELALSAGSGDAGMRGRGPSTEA